MDCDQRGVSCPLGSVAIRTVGFPILLRTQKVETEKCQGSAESREATLSNDLMPEISRHHFYGEIKANREKCIIMQTP